MNKHDHGQRYARMFRWTSSVSYDVERTSPLVSPYTGVLQFTFFQAYSSWMTKDARDRTTVSDCDPPRREKYKCLFAYQDEQWVLKSVLKNDDSSDWSPAILPSEIDEAVMGR